MIFRVGKLENLINELPLLKRNPLDNELTEYIVPIHLDTKPTVGTLLYIGKQFINIDEINHIYYNEYDEIATGIIIAWEITKFSKVDYNNLIDKFKTCGYFMAHDEYDKDPDTNKTYLVSLLARQKCNTTTRICISYYTTI